MPRDTRRGLSGERRHQDRLRRNRARAMERVVIAEAEEDEEVVVGFVLTDVVDQIRAGGPFRIEPRERKIVVVQSAHLFRDEFEVRLEVSRISTRS